MRIKSSKRVNYTSRDIEAYRQIVWDKLYIKTTRQIKIATKQTNSKRRTKKNTTKGVKKSKNNINHNMVININNNKDKIVCMWLVWVRIQTEVWIKLSERAKCIVILFFCVCELFETIVLFSKWNMECIWCRAPESCAKCTLFYRCVC